MNLKPIGLTPSIPVNPINFKFRLRKVRLNSEQHDMLNFVAQHNYRISATIEYPAAVANDMVIYSTNSSLAINKTQMRITTVKEGYSIVVSGHLI